MLVLYTFLCVFSLFLRNDANPQNVTSMKYVMMHLYSQVQCFERLVYSLYFPCHQVTKVTSLLTGQAEGPK